MPNRTGTAIVVRKSRAKREATPQPHDRLFKWTFSRAEHAAGFLRAVLPEEVVAEVDFRTLRLEKGSYIDRALRSRYSDLVFSARLRGRPVYFYVLIEHQRDVESLMIVRMGIYMMRMWEQLLREHPDLEQIPGIFPILVHHSAGGWTAATAFQDVVAGDDGQLRRGIIRFGAALTEVLRAPDAAAALEVLLRYLLATHRSLSTDEVTDIMEEAAGPEGREVIVTVLDEIELRGRVEGRAQMLLELLTARFGPVPAKARAQIRAADEATLARWAVRVLSAPSLKAVLDDDGGQATAVGHAGPRLDVHGLRRPSMLLGYEHPSAASPVQGISRHDRANGGRPDPSPLPRSFARPRRNPPGVQPRGADLTPPPLRPPGVRSGPRRRTPQASAAGVACRIQDPRGLRT